MATLKLTKNELLAQQKRLKLFESYLPTLKLKKSKLQHEVNESVGELAKLKGLFAEKRRGTEEFSPLLLNQLDCNVLKYAEISYVKKHYVNMAGVEIPVFEEVIFHEPDYFLFDTPAWTDRATELVRELVVSREMVNICAEKKRALEKELREVSIRVNLFEKILIPRSQKNIQTIKIFLGDQQLAAVSQAKVAKAKLREE
jgi:V/A-type H+-transporting ATPase subunit D